MPQFLRFAFIFLGGEGGLPFRRFTSGAFERGKRRELPARRNNKHKCTGTEVRVKRRRVRRSKLRDLPEVFPPIAAAGRVPVHIRFRVAIAGRVIIRVPARSRRRRRDVSFGDPHFLHGDA